jgi:AraC family transcriptional regulator, regulatory protein of adaptative response / methylated-DNA-[protein]-cysteine methyltransferase
MKSSHNGLSPSIIRYGTGDTPAGQVVVALTERGVCALRLTEGKALTAIVEELRLKFPPAAFIHDQEAVEPVMRPINEILEGRREAAEVPLDLQGTPFQKRVWETLLEVPRGTTCSYSQLAQKVGNPRAVRAVASACARNPVGLIVPCHRILRSDGSLGGYYWGLERKRALLHLEKANV